MAAGRRHTESEVRAAARKSYLVSEASGGQEELPTPEARGGSWEEPCTPDARAGGGQFGREEQPGERWLRRRRKA